MWGLDQYGLEGLLAASYMHENESDCSTSGRGFLEQMGDYRAIKNYSVPCV